MRTPISWLILLWLLPTACHDRYASDSDQPIYSAVREAYHIAQQQAATSLSEALAHVQHGIDLAQANQYLELEADGYLLYGTLVEQHDAGLDGLRIAVNHYLKAAELYEQGLLASGTAASHHAAGRGFLVFKDYDQAIYYLLKALARFEQLENVGAALQVNLDLSDAFWGTGNWDGSKAYADAAEELARRLGDQLALAASLRRKGELKLKRGDFAQARIQFKESHSILESTRSEQERILTLNRLAETALRQSNPQEAKAYLTLSLPAAQRAGDQKRMAEAWSLLAQVALQQQQRQLAIRYLDSSTAIARRHHFPQLLLDNYRLYVADALRNSQTEDRNHYWMQYHRLRDSIEEAERQDLAQRLHAQFDMERRAKQQRTQAIELDNKRYQVRFAVVIGGFLLLLAALLYQQSRSRQRLNLQLEGLVARRTEALNLANQGLQELNKELDTFAYRTAHDIRGPVARLLGLCQVVLYESPDSDVREYLGLMHYEAQQMDFMLHRFLEVNNIKHRKWQPETIDLKARVSNILEELQSLEHFEQVQFHISISPDIELTADPVLLDITLKNLVENAIIYQDREKPNGTVHFRAFPVGKQVEIHVSDNGIGIRPDIAPQIFEMFFRGTTVSKGLGLGLFATQLAAQAMLGSIYLNQKNPEETEFIMRLPMHPPEPNPENMI